MLLFASPNLVLFYNLPPLAISRSFIRPLLFTSSSYFCSFFVLTSFQHFLFFSFNHCFLFPASVITSGLSFALVPLTLFYSRPRFGEGERGGGVSDVAYRLIYESHASNPIAPRDTANDMCFSTLGIFHPSSRRPRSPSFSLLLDARDFVALLVSLSNPSRSYFTSIVRKIERNAEYWK